MNKTLVLTLALFLGSLSFGATSALAQYCGDTVCDPGEEVWTCPRDCPIAGCGDGFCSAGEITSCASDCTCNCTPAQNGPAKSRCTSLPLSDGDVGVAGVCDEEGACTTSCAGGTVSFPTNSCNPWENCTASSTNGGGSTLCTSAAAGTHGQINVAGFCAQDGSCSANCVDGSWTGFTNNCTVSCGNGILDSGEACDPGPPTEQLNGETCASQVGAGSTGNLDCNASCSGFITTGCSGSTCVVNGVCNTGGGETNVTCPADCYCDNGTVEAGAGEQCDDGPTNGTPCTPDYETGCGYCNATCQIVTLAGAFCGDNNIDAAGGEQCDDGAANGVSCGAGPCSYCGATCQTVNIPAASGVWSGPLVDANTGCQIPPAAPATSGSAQTVGGVCSPLGSVNNYIYHNNCTTNCTNWNGNRTGCLAANGGGHCIWDAEPPGYCFGTPFDSGNDSSHTRHQDCVAGPPPYTWDLGTWGSCGVSFLGCNRTGFQSRTKECRDGNGDPIGWQYCSGNPASSQTCFSTSCPAGSEGNTHYCECVSCVGGNQKGNITCTSGFWDYSGLGPCGAWYCP